MVSLPEVYRQYQPRILRYLGTLVSHDAAPDLTQSVFLKVSTSLHTLRDEASLASWIYRIATNTANDYAASSSCKGTELLLDEEGSLDDFPDLGGEGTENEYIRREMNACIRGIIDTLPENYRTVLILSELEELQNAEIALILNVTLETVKVRLHRARTALRNAMTSQCDLYHDDRNALMCDRKRE